MKNKKKYIIASSCIASAIVLTPLVSCACVFALHNETPVLDKDDLLIEDDGQGNVILKGIDWTKTSIEKIRIQEIRKLIIPAKVTEIAPYAFAYMFDGLSTYVNEIDFSNVKTTLKKIGDGAFNYCYGIESDLDFSDFSQLNYIGSEAFFYCTKVQNLKLPNVITIGDYAFFQNEGLTELTISSQWTVGSHAFDACSKIGKLDFSNCNSIPTWLWETSWVFNEIGKEASNPKALVSLDENDIDDWESALNNRQQLPSYWSIEAINNESTTKNDFVYDEKDKTIIIGLTDDAQSRLDEIKTISIPEGTTKITREAFFGVFSSGKTKVSKNLNLNKELVEIGDRAFASCDMLSCTLKLPTGMNKLGEQAFNHCFNLSGNVVIPKDVTELKDQVFAYSGINSIRFHNKIEKVGKQLFIGCSRLSFIDLSCYGYGHNPEWEKPESDEDKAFYNPNWTNGTVCVHYDEHRDDMIDQIAMLLEDHGMKGHINHHETWDTSKWKCFISDERFNAPLPQDAANKAYIIYQGQIKGLSYAFTTGDKYCNYGIIVTPDEAISIGNDAFKDTFNKKTYWRINLNIGLTSIGENAFSGDSNLIGSLIIPSSVRTIGSKAFYSCDHLSGSLILPKNIETISSSAFENTNFNTIVLPSTKKCLSVGDSAFVATPYTKNIDFTRFDVAPAKGKWHESFIKFLDGSKGTIWAASDAQKKAISAFLSGTDWSKVQDKWPIKVLGKDK